MKIKDNEVAMHNAGTSYILINSQGYIAGAGSDKSNALQVANRQNLRVANDTSPKHSLMIQLYMGKHSIVIKGTIGAGRAT